MEDGGGIIGVSGGLEVADEFPEEPNIPPAAEDPPATWPWPAV